MRYSLNPLDRWDAAVHAYTDQYGIWWRGGPAEQPKPQPAFQPPGTPLQSDFSQPGQPTSFDPGPDIGSILGGGDAGVGGGIGAGDIWDDVGGYVPTYDPTYSRPLPGDMPVMPQGITSFSPSPNIGGPGPGYAQLGSYASRDGGTKAEQNRSGQSGDMSGRYGGTGPINVGAGEERRAAQQQAQQNQVVRNEILRQLLSGGGFGGSLFRPLPNLQMPNATQAAIDRARREMGRTQLARAEEAAATGRAGSSLLSQQQADLDRAFLEAVGGIEAEQSGREFGLRAQQQQLEYSRQVAEAQAQLRQLQAIASLLGNG